MRVYKEEQRFTQIWLIVLLILSAIIPTTIITKLFINNQMNTSQFIIAISITLLGCGLIFLFKLKTRIDEQGIHYQFFPFHFKMKTIFWKEIKSVKTRTYNAMTEYGGWGLKGGFLWNKERGIAVNVKGNIGIQLILKNDKKILIGTQNRNDVDTVLSKYSK